VANDLVITFDRFDQLRFASVMKSPREERRALSLPEFVDRHSAHFSSWSALALVAKDKHADLWRLKCPCGKTWVGENRQLGIELG
jgi:hypothetical protein